MARRLGAQTARREGPAVPLISSRRQAGYRPICSVGEGQAGPRTLCKGSVS